MIIIGLDPHKRVHTASAVEAATNRRVAALEVEASLAGYRRLLKWAAGFSERRWAVENARGLGRHLAQWLVARGEIVDDVPSTATARVRDCRAVGGARTMASTPPPRPVLPRCRVTRTRSWPRI